MAALQELDGLLISFNNKFLMNLIQEGYDLSKIRFKFNDFRRPSSYRTFATYSDFATYFSPILNDPNGYCRCGKFAVIESINLSNQKLNFPNSYYARTITSKLQIQKNFKYDSYRKTFNDSQANLYQKYLTRRFTNYLTDFNTLRFARNQQYIDSCYVDLDYFEGDQNQLLTV